MKSLLSNERCQHPFFPCPEDSGACLFRQKHEKEKRNSICADAKC